MNKGNSEDIKELMSLLQQVNQKVSSARVLNGGFDRLENQIEDIKTTQDRMNEKLERLYDPEDGIYARAQKTDMMLTNMTNTMKNLSDSEQRLLDQVNKIDSTLKTTTGKVESIEKIAGEDNKDLENAVKTSKGFWKFVLWVGAALATAVGKIIWDFFVG